MHEKIFEILFNKDEITWQSLLLELVKSEGMDPWDIDISILSQKYIEMLKSLKKLDFHVSGKVVLAAALLLKVKSNRLVGEDIMNLDRLFATTQEEIGQQDDDDADFVFDSSDEEGKSIPPLLPRTPQPRKRKVSIYDLMEALQKAMDVKKRRLMRYMPTGKQLALPTRTFDIGNAIRELYLRIKKYFHEGEQKITFSRLVPSPEKKDKVYTFIPLLHLSSQRKVDLLQQEHFGEIEVELIEKGK
ncbi:segregation/condensation protein A [Candidatus Woesearchaeota archaeon]|nr:segregation/condensation protein A [Candidatus Woesearchaeota archaeon]